MRNEDQRGILDYFIPQYDEIALFAMSLSCALILITSVLSGDLVIRIDHRDVRITGIIAVFVFFAGLILSLYHAFTDRPKTSLEKSFMLFFAILLNSFSGIMAGMYDLATISGWLIIFPLLNIINGVVLFLLFRANVINEANIIDQHASRAQFAVTAAAVLILFVVCNYMASLKWVQTLSICVAYATNLGRRVPMLLETWGS